MGCNLSGILSANEAVLEQQPFDLFGNLNLGKHIEPKELNDVMLAFIYQMRAGA
jgi:hypothetical protein